MYLKRIIIENIGPISAFEYELEFSEDNNPIPLVLVGENGKGKTILSSYIADSLIEFAKNKGAFNNIVEQDGAFYRVINPNNKTINKKYSVVELLYTAKNSNSKLIYFEKNGKIPENYNLDKINYSISINDNENIKTITGASKKETIDLFNNNVLCYFPSYRSESPNWMNLESIKYNEIYSSNKRINGRLHKEIIIENSSERNKQWIKNVIVDSLVSIDKSMKIDNAKLNNSFLLQNSKLNLEKILAKILKVHKVTINLNYRNNSNDMNIICYDINSNVIKEIPNLSSLSLGEAILFNMFSTIIRHSDLDDLHNSVQLQDIRGIVVIDEIDMHLDSKIQYEVLPELIKLFPKIQFILTTHSPLFLLGMEKNENKFSLVELPTGNQITTERYSEFESSYNFFNDTKTHEKEVSIKIQKEINKLSNDSRTKTLIICEGKTDWKHIKEALKNFNKAGVYNKLDVDFLEFHDNMGESELKNMLRSMLKLKPKHKIIFIGDRDTDTLKDFDDPNMNYKTWDNNIFTFRIPVPNNMLDKPKISIEHYYDNEILKSSTDIKGITRRLFFIDEFDDNGDFIGSDNYITKTKKNSTEYYVLDGSGKNPVRKYKDINNTNYALSKENFFDKIIKDNTKVNFDSFKLIIDIIEEIEKL